LLTPRLRRYALSPAAPLTELRLDDALRQLVSAFLFVYATA